MPPQLASLVQWLGFHPSNSIGGGPDSIPGGCIIIFSTPLVLVFWGGRGLEALLSLLITVAFTYVISWQFLVSFFIFFFGVEAEGRWDWVEGGGPTSRFTPIGGTDLGWGAKEDSSRRAGLWYCTISANALTSCPV